MVTLGFYGAAGTVTGSKYLLTVNDGKYLIDCGIFQGSKELRQLNWQAPGFEPKDLQAVIITHGHIDHIGYLPRLRNLGYEGPVYATPPTIDISRISLLDTAKLQEEDAEYRNKKGLTTHAPALPLFTSEDAEAISLQFSPVQIGEWQTVSNELRFRYHTAGHLLGAASVEVQINDSPRTISVLFSGDVGRYNHPLIKDPLPPPECDYLICESTYGGKLHAAEDPGSIFTKIIQDVVKHRSILLIPAYAIGRTQQLIYLFNDLMRRGEIPRIDIHVDSPMAVTATDIYNKYTSYHGVETDLLHGKHNLLEGTHIHLHRKKKSSKELNDLTGPAIIISSSGMMTGGRILHHLLNRLDNFDTIIAIVGYQAEGTLGRRLLEGERQVYIHKTPKTVNARVINVTSMSGHADYSELLKWLEPLKKMPKMTCITHGEKEMSEAFASHLKEHFQWPTLLPNLKQTMELT